MKSIYINNRERIKGFVTGTSVVFFKSLINVIIVKLLVVLAGPSAIAIFSQLLNLNAIMTNVSTAAITTGIVTETASNRSDPNKLNHLFSTAFKINFFFTLGLIFIIVIFSNQISQLIFDNEKYSNYIILNACSAGFWGIILIFSSIINGYGRNREYLFQSFAVSLFFAFSLGTFFFTKDVAYFYYTYFLSQVVLVLVFLPYYSRKGYWSVRFYFDKIFDNRVVKNLSKFVAMSLASVFLVNLSQIIIRTYIIKNFDENIAGLWDAMVKISISFFGLLSSGLSIYFVPKIASTRNKFEIKKEIIAIFKLFTPVVLVSVIAIYLLRDFVVLVLYTPQFKIITNFFLPVLIADLFKWTAWIFAFVLMAKKKTRLYIINETIMTLFQISILIFILSQYGFQSMFYAYPIIFLMYLISSVIIVNKYVLKS